MTALLDIQGLRTVFHLLGGAGLQLTELISKWSVARSYARWVSQVPESPLQAFPSFN